ncbi:EF-hand domain pair [Nocardia amikacinitolerans]|uniref:EF-hand domain pair n=1 Tax=Nocardia amikacinitolerans TaxID=756689 RepID=A0A285LXI0_9NOCA|nr:EF-hand domain-containing protein [Nocardia amikacinitolerans]MCP2279740.1 EF-hand domain pair [Nocardia amikacinitolerans]MCP2298724.1 EF-hand domain pair [Nocardia amikacinitolerans]MCP2319215.1 EF-hand domain pair [Nocardia amikacinitolerans]SNY89622.1 EF-hand domain pair [Nocardia amikacinitolerans]
MDIQDIHEKFDSLDIDGDGYIDREEFIQHYERRGQDIDILASRFDEVDIDGDGRISRDEFLTAARAPL